LPDGEAGTAQQYNAVTAMCAEGTQVEWHTYPGLNPQRRGDVSLHDSLPFAQKLLNGQGIQGSCANLAPLGPPQKADPAIPFNN